MIVVVDYGMGNIGSILNMFKRLGAPASTASTPDLIASAERIVLPGVGAFDRGMTRLNELGLVSALEEAVLHRKARVLGICLGMQLLTRRSEEGALPGLGWIDADTVRFRFPPERTDLKVPHVGWNATAPARPSALFRGLETEARFYYVHSYHVVCEREEDVIATTTHGYAFASAIQRENIAGTQFHPEKSHRFGLRLLANFAGLP